MTSRDERRLEELDDEELRAEASRRGLCIGSALKRERLIELLSAGEEDVAEDEDAPGRPVEADCFATATMAEVLARQGHRDEALRLCRLVLESSPGDQRALRLVAELGDAGPTPPGEEDTQVVVEAQAGRWSARWAVAGDLDERARARAGAGARRVLRVFDVRAGGGVTRRHRDLDAPLRRGEAPLDLLEGRLFMVAIGWIGAGGEFLSMAHTAPAWAGSEG